MPVCEWSGPPLWPAPILSEAEMVPLPRGSGGFSVAGRGWGRASSAGQQPGQPQPSPLQYYDYHIEQGLQDHQTHHPSPSTHHDPEFNSVASNNRPGPAFPSC